MAVRWRSRRTAPGPADDGRWGVARLVVEREASRLARERAGTAVPEAVAPEGGADAAEPGTAGEPAETAEPEETGTGTAGSGATARDPVPGPRRPAGPPDPPPSRTPSPPAPRRAPAGPVPGLPAPRRPRPSTNGIDGPVYRPPAVSARPPVDLDPGLIGFSRLTRGRTGARVFTLFFVAVFLVILVQTLSTIV